MDTTTNILEGELTDGTVPDGEITDTPLSLYSGVSDNTGTISTFAKVCEQIRTGTGGLDKKTEKARHLLSTQGKDVYDRAKITLPAVTWGGQFHKRSKTGLARQSKMAVGDIDGLDNLKHAREVQRQLMRLPNVIFAFISPSGLGVKVVFLLANTTDAETHKYAFAAMRDTCKNVGLILDESGKDVSRLCFLAHDPEAEIKDNVTPLNWTPYQQKAIAAQNHKQRKRKKTARNTVPPSQGDADFSALDYLDPDHAPAGYTGDHDYNWWLWVGCRIKAAGGSVEIWDAWSRHGAKYSEGDCQRRWNGLLGSDDGTSTWGSVVYYAKQNGYIPARSDVRDARDTNASTQTSEGNDRTDRFPPFPDDFGDRIRAGSVEMPPIEVRERPSYPHFTPEQEIVCEKVFNRYPNAGWFRRDDGVSYPAYITRYSNFEKLTLMQSYQLNGFSEQLEKNHIIFGKPGICPKCKWGAMFAFHLYTLIGYAWCGKCHELHIYGSYQGYELNRKLPNAIVSDSHEYLGKNPDFTDFRLWQPGMVTHLACAMGTGKTTAAIERGKQIAQNGKGRLIYAGPRISLIKYLTEQYRKKDGHAAWGAWHAGSGPKNRFIGNFGAFACFPSLPYVLHATLESGYVPYLVLDEFDFDYLLTQVATEQSPAIKAWLKMLTEQNGIVTAGQTPYALSIEAFTKEIAGEVNMDTCQAFHQNAPPKHKSVTLHKLEDQPGKQNILWASAVEKAKDVLKDGKTLYIFCSLRRAAHTIAKMLENDTGKRGHVFDAYSKLYHPSEELLFGEKVPQGYDFVVLTGAADVGLSIKDPNGHVSVFANLNYGTLNMQSVVQMTQRVRDDVDIDIFYSENNHPLPIAPEENTTFSLEHEREKQVFNPAIYISEGAVEHIAKVRAMRDLNDADPETYIKHHLGTVANKPICKASVLGLFKLKHTIGESPLSFSDDPLLKKVNEVKSVKKQLQNAEREEKTKHALDILQSKDLLTLSEIRSEHNMTPERKMGHEIATGTAIALGWDENKDNKLSDNVTTLAKDIVEQEVNHEVLVLQQRGFLSVHYRDFVQARLTDELMEATAETQTKESHAIKHDLGIGEVLQVLLDVLKGQVWTPDTLGDAVLKALVENGLLEKLKSGKIGSSEAKNARFLYKGNSEYILNWTKKFISTWYPLRLAQSGDNYALALQENYQLRIKAFHTYLNAKDYAGETVQTSIETIDLPEPHNDLKVWAQTLRSYDWDYKTIAMAVEKSEATIRKWCQGIQTPTDICDNELKQKARHMRGNGKTIKDIASQLGKAAGTISTWCKGIQTPAQAKNEQQRKIVIEMRLENKTYEQIAKELDISERTIQKWLS